MDPIASIAQALVWNLRKAIGEQSIRSVARAAGIDHSTLLAILAGSNWPDLATIGRLERALRADLWPSGVSQQGLDLP